MVSGTVVMYKVDKGFGFAKKDGAKEGDKDVWFGVKSWKERIAYEKVKPGIRVHFDLETNEGKERAVNMTGRNQEGRGQWAVYYTSPQSFILTFSYSFVYQLWGISLRFDLLIH